MSSVRQFRKKIKSAKNIAKLTRAMQFVAASKMKKAQEQAAGGKDYVNGLISLSYLLSNYLDPKLHPLLQSGSEEGKVIIVLVAPEKGLCGSLVTNLSKKLILAVEAIGKQRIEFITVGKKANQVIRRIGGEIIAEFTLGLSSPKYETVPPIANLIEERFRDGLASRVVFIFSEFVNTLNQVPTERTLLPLKPTYDDTREEPNNKDYLFEPSAKEVVEPFLEMYLEVEIYQILQESYAAEQSARMVAMKNATDNAQSLIGDLSLEYNKVRQSIITAEILDIGNAVGMLSNA
ncbi:ATP synthase F1 subunit gamma [Candidatus Woesebacteria bacterium RIFCSPLOWO2_01_FULL_39_10]|uniref:ATP synthase gamma chain n=1 Tax=Candidatus Woesebacteria bacterium RIFCSPLOWO2_01_FULL_39_10 TaxID=1802516 RepID=A0A1F8B7R1_9BACT|nr:MAG: ATP synthase F1 subunit gamma [Candidatus Woesebacteria bacterium RIFCSPLOWO2_01_FULL_39_10]